LEGGEKMNKKSQKGFTLIELLVVVTIIAILALIAILAINPVEMARRSRDSRRLADLGTLRKAIDLSMADNTCTLPVTAAGGITVNSGTSVITFGGTACNISKYLSVVPGDPAYDTTALATAQAAKGDCSVETISKALFVYNFRSDALNNYVINTRLESKDNCKVLTEDGNVDNYYEIGTDPSLDLP
jgi:prepilin-type N-terminal cleavage/methylation domain-containing protein